MNTLSSVGFSQESQTYVFVMAGGHSFLTDCLTAYLMNCVQQKVIISQSSGCITQGKLMM